MPAQIIDPAVIGDLGSVSTSRGFLGDLLFVAGEDIGRIRRGLAQAQASRDLERLREQAHALEGVAARVGADRLAALAAELALAARGSPQQALVRLLMELAEVSNATVAALLATATGPAIALPGPKGLRHEHASLVDGRPAR